jgi:hypothetical protein
MNIEGIEQTSRDLTYKNMRTPSIGAIKEYVIWGVPKGKKDETILFTKAKNMAEAKNVMKILENKYDVKKTRIQVIDLSKSYDIKKEFTQAIGAVNTYKKDELSLIDEIKKNSTLVKGKISTSPQDGVRYRYDRYVFKYPHALNYLVKKFESLAGRSKNINIGNFSIYYDRPKFAGSKNGSFMMTELVENI